MCGRFTQQMSWTELHELYSVYTVPMESALPARFNGAPTQEFAACRIDETRQSRNLRTTLGSHTFLGKRCFRLARA